MKTDIGSSISMFSRYIKNSNLFQWIKVSLINANDSGTIVLNQIAIHTKQLIIYNNVQFRWFFNNKLKI